MRRLPQANKWRGQPFTRYTNRFHGYCFYCKGFGHKAMECRTYGQILMFKTPRRFINNGEFTRTHNPFKIIIKFFVCNQIGQISSKCPLKECGPYSQKRCQKNSFLQWKKKLNKCDLALIAQDQKSQWYMYSGCSKHMTGDQSKFLTFDEKKSEM